MNTVQNGKGSKRRPGNDEAYRNEWDRIFGPKKGEFDVNLQVGVFVDSEAKFSVKIENEPEKLVDASSLGTVGKEVIINPLSSKVEFLNSFSAELGERGFNGAGYYFWDEIDVDCYGPYETEEKACKAAKGYYDNLK